MSKTCLFLRCQRDHNPGALAGRVESRHLTELAGLELAGYGAILVSMLADQVTLAEQSRKLEAFLDGGGILVFNGHVAHAPVDGLTTFVPQAGRGIDSLTIHRLADHPVYDGVSAPDLTFRRGVAGFYARGHNPPPAGAVALNGLGPDKVPTDWIWHRPGGGTVLMHCGLDLWAFAGDPTTASRMAPQLLNWLEADVKGNA